MSIGIDRNTARESTPLELMDYVRAYKIQTETRDAEMWRNGLYTLSALQSALSGVFGKSADYIKKPLLSDTNASSEATDEQYEAFVADWRTWSNDLKNQGLPEKR